MIDVGKSLAIAMATKGVSGKNLGTKINVSESYISNIKGGRARVSMIVVEKIATALDYKVSEFIALGEH